MCDTILNDLQKAGVVPANRPAPVVSSPPWRGRLQAQTYLPAAAASASSWLPAGWLDGFGQPGVLACEDVNAKANMCYLFIYIYIGKRIDLFWE